MAAAVKYAGILFRAVEPKTGEVRFLLGREADVPGWSEAKKWSDFGIGGAPPCGGRAKDAKEDPIETMAREATEEMMGMRGCAVALAAEIHRVGQTIHMPERKAVMCLMDISYDESLPAHYNHTYMHLTKCMKDHPGWKGFRYIPSCPEGYLEKTELRWWSLDEIVAQSASMRTEFYKSFLFITDYLKARL